MRRQKIRSALLRAALMTTACVALTQEPSRPGLNGLPVEGSRASSDGASEVVKRAADHPAAGAFTNSLGMQFVPVPGTAVLFGIWETRVRDFAAFVDDTGHDALQGMRSLGKEGWRKRGRTWNDPGFPQTPGHPVVGVSWNDAQAFCRWLSRKEGRTYRLPTDREWSIAVGLSADGDGVSEGSRGGAQQTYPWGPSFPPPPTAGNYAGSEVDEVELWPAEWKGAYIRGFRDQFAHTAPVGSFAPNRHGLYDMGGNVWEWCGDNPRPTDETSRILRGGGWIDSGGASDPPEENLLLSSFRNARPPFWRYDAAGFRVVLEVR